MTTDRATNAHCRYCGRPVLWASTPSGRRMPIDPAPDTTGNVLLVGLTAHVQGPGDAQTARDRGDRLYLPHAATCPPTTRRNR